MIRICAFVIVATLAACNFGDPVEFTGSPSCESDADCGGHGSCESSRCVCDEFFTGPTCGDCVSGRELVGDACVESGANNVVNGTANNTTPNNGTVNNTTPTNNANNTNNNTNNAVCAAAEYPCADDCCVSGEFCHEGACIERFVGRRCANDAACGADGICLTQQTSGITGGVCTKPCDAVTPCPDGSSCETSTGSCVPNCNVDNTCLRTEFTCGVPIGGTVEGCRMNAIGANPVGDACVSAVDCAGGINGFCDTSWPQGTCSHQCASDMDCPGGSHCTDSACYANCIESRECRTGYACVDADFDTVTECAPLATGRGFVGDACTAPQECQGGQFGRCGSGGLYGDDGYCVLDCSSAGTTCTAPNACIRLSLNENVCMLTCATDADCTRPGYTCQNPTGVPVCAAAP